MSIHSKIKNGETASIDNDNLTKFELEFLLKIISESTFKGKDVQIIYNTVVKLQNSILALQK